MPNYELVAIQSFGEYRRGAVISDPTEMEAVQAAHPHCVVTRATQSDPQAEAPVVDPPSPPAEEHQA